MRVDDGWVGIDNMWYPELPLPPIQKEEGEWPQRFQHAVFPQG